MQKDIYAIYEAYVTEGQEGYAFGSSQAQMPGKKNLTSAGPNDNNRERNPMVVAGGKDLPMDSSANPPYQGEETREHKSLKRELAKLNELVRDKKYQDVVMYCNCLLYTSPSPRD